MSKYRPNLPGTYLPGTRITQARWKQSQPEPPLFIPNDCAKNYSISLRLEDARLKSSC